MHDRTEWTRGTSGPLKIRGKEYKNLTEFMRPCAACGKSFSIFVTAKIASGHADSNSFGLKNCEDHRRNKSSSAEEERLRTANVTMREELTGLYDRVRELEARLAVYELPAAMRAQAEGAPDYDAFDAGDLWRSQKVTTTNSALPKMPWQD